MWARRPVLHRLGIKDSCSAERTRFSSTPAVQGSTKPSTADRSGRAANAACLPPLVSSPLSKAYASLPRRRRSRMLSLRSMGCPAPRASVTAGSRRRRYHKRFGPAPSIHQIPRWSTCWPSTTTSASPGGFSNLRTPAGASRSWEEDCLRKASLLLPLPSRRRIR